MNEPKISIITSTYNSVNTLEQTISSIVNQTYKNIEYIIIDGGSTDGTVELIKKYKNQIAYWVSEPDKGIYDALNKGIKAATGDYVYIIGSDDCLTDSGILSKVSSYLTPDVDVLSASVYVLLEDFGNIQQKADNLYCKETYKGGMVPHQGLFVKTDLAKKHLFDTSYKIAADYKMFLDCLITEKAKVVSIDLPIAFFTHSGKTGSGIEQILKEDAEIEKEFGLTNILDKIRKESKLKKKIKNLIIRLGIFKPLKYLLYVYVQGWEKHHCNNEICRWCKRK